MEVQKFEKYDMFLESSPSSLICAIYLQFATALTYVIEPSFRLWLPGGQWHYCHPAPKNFFFSSTLRKQPIAQSHANCEGRRSELWSIRDLDYRLLQYKEEGNQTRV